MQILPATLRDLGSLRALEQACFPEDVWPLLDLIGILTYARVVRLKRIEDGRMVGFVAGDPNHADGHAWIATIAVLPEFQGRGIGRALLQACESKLTTESIRLCVRPANTAAIHLYESEGYQHIDLWQKYYKDGGSTLVMEKPRRPTS